MPGAASGSTGLVVDRPFRPNYERLRSSVQNAAAGRPPVQADADALAELTHAATRARVAAPLAHDSERPPSPADRARIAGLGEVTLGLAGGDSGSAMPSSVRLGADLVSVAIALSDELQINELDAAVLLFDARAHATHRPDHDVVAAAKELFALRRRESVLYLQEVLRAALMAPLGDEGAVEQGFLAAVARERDALVVQHSVVSNIINRLSTGLDSFTAATTAPAQTQGRLHEGEALLLAECLFLLGYTVQMTSSEALAVRALLDKAIAVCRALVEKEQATARAHRWSVPPSGAGTDRKDASSFGSNHSQTEVTSPAWVEAESVRNLILLVWVCALDRSRYQDVYDPRTSKSGINSLLQDENFICRTSNVPALVDNEEDKVQSLDKACAAAELCGALFRLAVAVPDEDEAITTALRVSAFGGALDFLSSDLPIWIEKGAGSLSPDADLYADVLEDLALDMAEAPNLAVSLIQFTQNEVIAAASFALYANFDTPGTGIPSLSGGGSLGGGRAGSPTHRFSPRYGTPLDGQPSASPVPSVTRRSSLTVTAPGGKPPKPPGPRSSFGPRSSPLERADNSSNARLSLGQAGSSSYGATPVETFAASPRDRDGSDSADDVKPPLIAANMVALLARFVARAVSLAPSKLNVDSIGGGPRYWVGIGAAGVGLIQRIGDAVIDLWDASMRNAYAAGGVGDAFIGALEGFLDLLSATAGPEGSMQHAARALRYLCEAGHPVVSLARASMALGYFNDLLSSPNTPRGAELDSAEVNALCGIIDIIARAAEAAKPHGGIAPLLGQTGNDLALRIASLAVHDVTPKLKASLIHALDALGDRRAISLYLETAASEKASPLRRLVRGAEAESGCYAVTVRALDLATISTQWRDDEYPSVAVETIASWFAIEEVLTHWSRRKYIREEQRWRVVRAASNLLLAIVKRDPTSDRLMRVVARLLTPAPGTGAASYALRALVSASGLMRAPEDGSRSVQLPDAVSAGHATSANLYSVCGRESLVFAAQYGLGDAFREMQLTAKVAARMVTVALSIPPGRASAPGMVVAPATELLLGEVGALSAASSMVFAVSGFTPSVFRAGYDPSVCAAVLAMLAKATQESSLIATLLTRDASGMPGSATRFRSSLADIIARAGGDPTIASDVSADAAAGDVSSHETEGRGESTVNEGASAASLAHVGNSGAKDPPIMYSALRIVESSLGVDGGSAPGMFLLGLHLDASGRYASAEYGVLGALVELVAGTHDIAGRLDDKCRSTAAIFLERLAANTVRRTSMAVLDHLREVGGSDPSVRGGGFADEMLFRILDVASPGSIQDIDDIVDWEALGELAAACMSLSALQVRMFPSYEVERCLSHASDMRNGILRIGDGNSRRADGAVSTAPSPHELMRLLMHVAGSGAMQVAFEAFRSWHHLIGTRLGVHTRNCGYSSVPVLFELATSLLGALSGSDTGNDLAGLVKKDGGETAAAAVLACVARMRDCDNPHEPGSEEFIGDIQCSALLSGVVRALAGVVGVSANASRARTSLYASLLVCGRLAESRAPEEAVARAFGGRLGPRQVSGAEAVISAACTDAVSGPTAATRAAAMAAASMTTMLDPVRAMPALGAQNRLRRVVSGALAEEGAQKLVCRACERISPAVDGGNVEATRERAAMVVAESALALMHAVSSAGHGARTLADAGCIESAAAMLAALGSPSLHRFAAVNADMALEQSDVPRQRVVKERQVGFPDRGGGERESMYGDGYDEFDADMEEDELDPLSAGDRRASMVGSIAGAIAAAVTCADASLVDGALVALEHGETVFGELLRGLRSSRISYLSAASALAMILSRLPQDVLCATASPTQLRMVLAASVGVVIPAVSPTTQLGGSGSLFGAGLQMRRPQNPREARRMRIMHPEGGSLFERDLIQARASCAQSVFAALRPPAGLLFLFAPRLTDGSRGESQPTHRQGQRVDTPIGKLSDVVRICRAALAEVRRSAEESMQMDARVAGETGTSISSRRLNELADFCTEEFGVPPEGLNGDVAIECMKEASSRSRAHADRCISIFESALFILREYVRNAREVLRGTPPTSAHRSARHALTSDRDEQYANAETLSFPDADVLLGEAKNVLLPICKEIDSVAGGMWGSRDPSFCKQLSRQIRTACTGRG